MLNMENHGNSIKTKCPLLNKTNNLSSFINGIHDSNGHGHVGRSLSVGDSIPEEDEEELDLEELENTAVDINGAGQRKGHRSGSFASTGEIWLDP